MLSVIAELAEKIAELDSKSQEKLLERVSKLNYQRGLYRLSEKYRMRLKKENMQNEEAEAILERLRKIRSEIAYKDYPNEG